MVDIPDHGRFLADIERFLKRHDVAPTTFGTQCMNNPAFLNHLRDGRSVTLRTAKKVYDYIKLADAMKALR